MAISIGRIMVNHVDQAEYRYPIFRLKWVIAKRWKLSLSLFSFPTALQ